jgi:hypothetical protein
MALVLILLLVAGPVPRRASAAQPDCGRIGIRAQVEVPEGGVTLGDLLDAGTCSATVRAASQIRLGVAPLAGSPRVLRGDEVRALLERLQSGDLETLRTSIPPRVTIRRAERGLDCSNSAAHLAISPDGIGESSRTCASRWLPRAARSGNLSANHDLVRRGERVTLEWDSSGIRITVPAVAVDGGVLGAPVRARIVPSGRMMRAVVMDRGQVRAGS